MAAEIAKDDEMMEAQSEVSLVDDKTEDKLLVSTLMTSTDPLAQEEWRQFGEKTSTFITNLQNSAAEFFKAYQPILGSLGWIVLAVITVKLTLALLGAINDIPFLSLILELIGLGYTAWFIARYLLAAASRQELSRELENFKQQVFNSES